MQFRYTNDPARMNRPPLDSEEAPSADNLAVEILRTAYCPLPKCVLFMCVQASRACPALAWRLAGASPKAPCSRHSRPLAATVLLKGTLGQPLKPRTHLSCDRNHLVPCRRYPVERLGIYADFTGLFQLFRGSADIILEIRILI